MGQEFRTRRLPAPAIYAVLLAIVGAFFLTFFNRFAGLRSGDGEFTGGVAFLNGVMPYRDYFTTAPPLNVLKSALLQWTFGSALIVNRAAGVAERMLIAAVLFRWLRQIFRPLPALVASAVTLIVSAGDRTDPVASYNHDAILWVMLSGLLGSVLLQGRWDGWKSWGLAMLSGCCAGLGALTKQTVGVGGALAVLVAVAVLRWATGERDAMRWVAGFASGCTVPLAVVAGVLARWHLLWAFSQMLFVRGPAAKAAHPSDFLIRELLVAWDNFGWLALGSFALLLSWRPLSRFRCEAEDVSVAAADGSGSVTVAEAGWVLLWGLGVLAAGEALRGLPALHDFSKSLVYFTCLGLTVLVVRYGFAVRGGSTGRQAQCLFFCLVSWGVAATLSLSWPAFEAMALPGLGFLVAAVVESARPRALPYVYAVLVLVAGMQVREKLDLPFGFDYQDEGPVREAMSRSVQPALRGMRLPEPTVRFLDETVATIRANTRDGDTIFVYPEMGLLYALSGRMYPTFSGSHNMDVVSDSLAAEEAERVRRGRPAVIVYYRITEQQQRDAERLWRAGGPSGQRLLVQAIEELLPGYRLAGQYQIGEGDPEILVYVRKPA